jgi:hypothetical protein
MIRSQILTISLVMLMFSLYACSTSSKKNTDESKTDAATAVDCAGGSIKSEAVDEIIIDGQSCLIIGVTVERSVRVRNSAAIIMVENDVGHGIEVTDSAFVGIVNNRIISGDLEVIENVQVQVLDNRLLDGDIRVVGNDDADVNRNEASGDIFCDDNRQLDSFLNHADGKEECRR